MYLDNDDSVGARRSAPLVRLNAFVQIEPASRVDLPLPRSTYVSSYIAHVPLFQRSFPPPTCIRGLISLCRTASECEALKV